MIRIDTDSYRILGQKYGLPSQKCGMCVLLNRFNVVVANGHGDIEMWTIESRPCKLYDAHDTGIGLELEEAFILNVGRTGRDIGFNSSY